jgi:rhodanese-related sulfurtransferase
VRNEEDFERWRVEGRASLEVLNVPYFDFIEDEAAAFARIPHGVDDVLVVCAKEGSAEYVAEILQSRGLRASYLAEGIVSWGAYYDVRDVVETEQGRIVQIARPARGDLSFVVLSDGDAAIIILYDSLFDRLPPHLNENTLILPAHFGTLDEDEDQGRFAKPYHQVQAENEALRPRPKQEFLDFVLSHLPTFPEEYIEIKQVNIGLVEPTEEEASELELGKNICALTE